MADFRDWSEPCILASKALASAQACAALHKWEEAYRECSRAILHLDEMRNALPVSEALKSFHV